MMASPSPPVDRRRELAVRIAAAAALIPLALLLAWLGGWWFAAFVAFAGVLMAREWCAIVHSGAPLQLGLHGLAVLAAALMPGVWGAGAALVAIAAVWLAALVEVWWSRRERRLWVLAGVPYVALPALALVVLRGDPEFGLLAVVWLFVVVWVADTGAYAAGRSIGGRKLAPAISPGKTWAGLFGALFGAGLAAGIVGAVAGLPWLAPVMVIGGILGVVEQAGDLYESALKRAHGRKDSGALIPGHGGMLDRVDGLVAAAMVAALIGMARSGPERAGAGLLAW